MEEKHLMGERFGASVTRGGGLEDRVGVRGRWEVVCRDKDGNIKWTDHIENLVTDEGLNYLLDAGLSAGTPVTSWFVGLTGASPTVAAGDTMASHAGWTEVVAYTEATRPAWTDGGVTAKSVSNSGSPATFTINANGTGIGGAFLVSNSTKGGSTGTLYAVGAFSAGNKTLDNGDSLSVTATFTAAAS